MPRKKIKTSLKRPTLIAGIAVIVFPTMLVFFLSLKLPVYGSYGEPAAPTGIRAPEDLVEGNSGEYFQAQVFTGQAEMVVGRPAVLPSRLTIPRIKVNAAIESVGLTKDGAIGIPKGPTNVAWFNLGPRPGDIGSAVITGHFGVWKGGLPTVFNNLYKLRKGDKIYIKDKKGTTITFVVRELVTYGENENAPDVFTSNDGKAHLNLITCQGIWNKKRKSYSERLVVFTDAETK